MSNSMVHPCLSDDTSQTSHPTGKQKRKKSFHKKMKGKQNYVWDNSKNDSKHDQTPHQNGANTKHPPPSSTTQNKSLPHSATTVSASHGSSKPSTSSLQLPLLSFTVNNKSSLEKPKESVRRNAAAVGHGPLASASHKPTTSSVGNPTKYLAIDCEMVGTGPKGSIGHLARCSIVSYDGDVVYDKFVKPSVPVTDYRTRWSGIRPKDLKNATLHAEARKEILRLLMGKVVIGHAIHNDFKALSYTHPSVLTRDTSRIPLLNLKAGFGERECASLKRLTKAIFNRDIQVGRKGHSSVEDARATMELYKVVEEEWERTLLLK